DDAADESRPANVVGERGVTERQGVYEPLHVYDFADTTDVASNLNGFRRSKPLDPRFEAFRALELVDDAVGERQSVARAVDDAAHARIGGPETNRTRERNTERRHVSESADELVGLWRVDEPDIDVFVEAQDT